MTSLRTFSIENIGKCLAFALTLFFVFAAEAATAQTAINANDRGWYNASGSHNPGNNNTYTGFLNQNYHSYFRFTIPAGISCVSEAVFELEIENYYGDGVPHTASIYDVAPVYVPLLDTSNGSGNGVAIHNDLGSGAIYGSQSGLTSANVGSVLNFTLPAAALTNIAAASGSDFAIGSKTTSASGARFWGLRYSGGNETRIHRLTITECADLPNLNAVKSVAIFDPGATGLYALPGNDMIYTITVTNTGAGSVDEHTMVLIDKIPENTIFYNGDIDGTGPETNPVSFLNSGSGLTFDYTTDVGFSDLVATPVDFAACTYAPIAGYDSNVKHICINPKETMGSGTPSPEFAVSFRAKIK